MSELEQYKCPNCGGSVEYNSRVQKLKCPYCDTVFDKDTIRLSEEAFSEISDNTTLEWDTDAGKEWEDEEKESVITYVCENCGGEILSDGNTTSTLCPYCDSPVVMKGNISGNLKPDMIIPFKLDKKQAIEAYSRHIQGKKLLPRIFKEQNHIDEIRGLYVPFWLFDADAVGDVVFKATRTRFWADSEYDYTETSFYRVFRSGSMSFEYVPVDGASKMPDELMQSIEPFDMNDAVDFESYYLAGFMADKYDVTANDNLSIANERIKTSTSEALRNTVTGYATVSEEKAGIRLANGKAHYAMFPVWILNTTYKGEKYTFAMNGQTGKMVGDLPMDRFLYWRNFSIFGLVSAAVVFAAEYLLELL